MYINEGKRGKDVKVCKGINWTGRCSTARIAIAQKICSTQKCQLFNPCRADDKKVKTDQIRLILGYT